MKTTGRYLVLIALLLGMFASYSVGFGRGIFILLVLGVIFEIAFWLGLFNGWADNDSKE